mgnify:CR=1 FL=1
MNLQELIDYTIIPGDKFTLTFSDILIAILILVATRIILYILKKVFKRTFRSKAIDPGKGYTVYQLIKYLLWVIAITITLQTIGVKVGVLLAGSAALLVGIGLGVQQVFKDIISGIFLLFEGNLKVGDVVELEGVVGIVKDIGFRTTKIETRDNIIMIIPNSRFIAENVINWSHIEQRTRFHVSVGVAYGSNVQLVESILLECAKEHQEITDYPSPFVRFYDFGNSSLDFQLFFWTNNAFRVENIKSDLRFVIDRKFRDNKVTIPFPQRDVHIKNP